jgi:hypothetical protein
MLTSTEGGGGGGSFTVQPAELDSAATTLRSVIGELSGRNGTSVGALGLGDLGYGDLTGAVHDLCAKAGDVATTMSAAVEAAGRTTSNAAGTYAQTDQTAIPGGSG